jgi:hypothetical protein
VFTIQIPADRRCLKRGGLRILEPRTGRATYYRPLDVFGEPVVRLEEPAVLPWVTPAIDLPPEGDPDQARPVTFDDGLVLDVVPSLYYSLTGSYEGFAGRRVPVDAVGLTPTVAENLLEGLYAFYPEGEMNNLGETSPGYPLHIPNATGIDAGAKVEFFVLGGLECYLLDGSPVTEAEWAKFGEGTVSADGATIDSDPGAGLPCFTWLGYRTKE